jgi:pyruvate,water dikinase
MQSATSANLTNISENTRSYAFVSVNYLNFFSQLGFHFSRLDAFVSENINQNYINFNFRGGATSDLRKSRRAIAISRILEYYGFNTLVRVDDVSAKSNHIKPDVALDIIKTLGRLMGFIRNADALMLSDHHIDLLVKSFLSGDSIPKLD